jgi:hypothetical protein
MLGRLDISLLGQIGQALTPRINEREAFQLTIRALTADLAAATPSTMRYRIQDMDQCATVLDWTTLAPATAVSLIITGAQNAMRNGCDVERRQILVEASDSDGAIRRTFDYEIQNLQGIT